MAVAQGTAAVGGGDDRGWKKTGQASRGSKRNARSMSGLVNQAGCCFSDALAGHWTQESRSCSSEVCRTLRSGRTRSRPQSWLAGGLGHAARDLKAKWRLSIASLARFSPAHDQQREEIGVEVIVERVGVGQIAHKSSKWVPVVHRDLDSTFYLALFSFACFVYHLCACDHGRPRS